MTHQKYVDFKSPIMNGSLITFYTPTKIVDAQVFIIINTLPNAMFKLSFGMDKEKTNQLVKSLCTELCGETIQNIYKKLNIPIYNEDEWPHSDLDDLEKVFNYINYHCQSSLLIP